MIWTESSSTSSIPTVFTRGAVKRSVALAQKKLRAEECRAIFTDFSDLEGRPLAENLEGTGLSASEHLGSLQWVNGSTHPICRNPTTYFWTWVGGHTIHVCPRQFAELATKEPMKAAGFVLHEQLHALGLGENPPTSREITRQVFARCGS